MKEPFSDYLVPHKGNDDKPHIVRSASLLVLFFIVIIVFAASVFETSRIRGDSHFIAAVLPGVLATLTNDDRTEHGLRRLEHNPVLEIAAQLKANDMVTRGYFDHVSPDGVTPWAWFEMAGYSYVHAGENLAINFSESADVVNAWMNSEGHRMNILDSKFTETGIATAVGMYKGKEAVYVVQLFGTPRQSAAAVSPAQTEDTEPEILSSPVQQSDEPAPPFGVVAGSEASLEGDLDDIADQVSAEEVTPNEETEMEVVAQTNDTDSDSVSQSNLERVLPTTAEEGLMLRGEDDPQKQTSFTRWFSHHPARILQIVYVLVGVSLVFALGLMVRREAYLRHPRSVAAGVFLILLMIVLAYITREYTLPMQFFASFW